MTTMLSKVRPVLALLLVVTAAGSAIACGPSTNVAAPSSEPPVLDAGVGDAAPAPTATATPTGSATATTPPPAQDVFGRDATKVVFTVKGGFVPMAPKGSTCQAVDNTYTLSLPSRELSWKVCAGSGKGPLAYKTGKKTLGEAEYAPLETALRGVKKTPAQRGCGADKPELALTVTSGGRDSRYIDDFYYCTEDGKPYVSGLDAVSTEFDKLAK